MLSTSNSREQAQPLELVLSANNHFEQYINSGARLEFEQTLVRVDSRQN